MMLYIHRNRNLNDTNEILNTNNSKSNERYSKDKSENDHRDIDIFVEKNLQNKFYVFSNNDSDKLMEKKTILNKNDEFENNEFDDLKDENFDDIFVNKKVTTK